MAGELSLLGFASLITKAVALYEAEKAHALKQAAKVLQEESQRVIGTYDYGWQELADSTKADRLAQGYAENDPLLRTGDMRASIEISAVSSSFDNSSIEVGSDDDKAVWQELGTDRIPARSFLGFAAIKETPAIVEILGGAVPLLTLPKKAAP